MTGLSAIVPGSEIDPRRSSLPWQRERWWRMAQFVAFAPTVQVRGEAVLAVLDGMGSAKDKALDILADNNIHDPKAEMWYLQRNWLSAFQQISETLGEDTLVAIGRKIPANALCPPQIDSIEEALQAIDVGYHMSHRGGDIGSYEFQSTGPRSAKMVCRNPYPCVLDRGIIEAMVARFKPEDSAAVSVRHDDPAPCRRKGADSCTYLVTW
jgi:hypothetical protein